MNRLLPSSALMVCCLCAGATAHAARNLVGNGEFEGAANSAAQDLPGGWEPLVVGAPAKIQVDKSEKHDGQSSVRIDAADITRAYVRSSGAIEVAPGEAIAASAWVKVRDVPADKGTVIMIAEFADAAGDHLGVEKFNVLNVKNAADGWQPLEGSVKVPAGAARLHLRLGLSYSRGTVWWDDVSVTAKQPLVVRIDLPERRLTPAVKKLPVTLLNRAGARKPLLINVALNKQARSAKHTPSGNAVERLGIPIGAVKPGALLVQASLRESNDAPPLFVHESKVTVPPPLTLGVPSPTHWVMEDMQPVVEGLIEVAVTDGMRRGASLSVRLLDGDGSLRGEWRPGGGDPRNGRQDFTLKLARVEKGPHKLVASFRPARGEAMTVEQPWHVITRTQSLVTINARGFPEHDGKAIFPLGIFNGARFKEQAEAGFTVTHAYNAARIEGADLIAADQRALGFLNNTQQHGMKMLLMVPMKLVIAGDWDGVRRRVRMFRNHPGLLAWDEEEGFARGDFRPDTLKTLRQILQEEDPNHPFMVGDSRGVISRIPSDRADFFPVAEMDLGMWWWYPFPLKAGAGDALAGEEAAGGVELTPPSFLTNAKTQKALWVGVQSYKKPGDGNRYPTPQEYRAQAYLAIIHGARGLMWYGGSVTGGLFLAPDEGHWPELKKLVRELRDQSDLFMSPTDTAVPTVLPHDAPVSAIVKRTPKGKVLIAVNRSAQPHEVTVAGRLVTLDGFEVMVEKL